MGTEKINKEIETKAQEFVSALKMFSDIESAIIRGHILIEQAINNSLEQTILFKDEYDADRFSFSQNVIICNMLGLSNRFKIELNALNKLRNQIAHSLKFDDNLVSLIVLEVEKKDPKIFENENSLVERLIRSIAFVCGAISFSHKNVIYNFLEKHIDKKAT